jgi:predicted AlkP superfamily pyrophosphatase or phosphodiesterase
VTRVLPDYAGGCISNVIPALLEAGRPAPWLPAPLRDARQVVLLVLDGLGWLQLRDRPGVAPMLSSMVGDAITSVAPTTTSTALTSITIGCPPARHGVLGYRLRVADGQVLNVLRWRTGDGDARQTVPPASFQAAPAFGGRHVPVVTRAEFKNTGFTTALGIADLRGWHAPSAIAVEVRAALEEGAPLVYAYYDGVDKIAHLDGFGAHYDAELGAADRIVADIAAALPAGAALAVTADHGQVEVRDRVVVLGEDVVGRTTLISGEGRFLWLHAKPGAAADLLAAGHERYEVPGHAWVCTREQIVDEGWFGGPVDPSFADRLGDIALVAREPIAFLDPADPGSAALLCRHGSLTADEMLVPLVAVGSTR